MSCHVDRAVLPYMGLNLKKEKKKKIHVCCHITKILELSGVQAAGLVASFESSVKLVLLVSLTPLMFLYIYSYSTSVLLACELFC